MENQVEKKMENEMDTIIMEHQMEKKMENEMETGIILRVIRLPVEGLPF